MTDIFNVYKPLGWTPLEAITALKGKFPELKTESITYAGRLDPMAEGVLILLKGKTIKDKDSYLKLPKTYHAQILFGLQTDTYDLLGICGAINTTQISSEEIQSTLHSFIGKQSLKLPPYSSPTVEGKALFQHSRENTLSEIEIPKKEFNILNIESLNISEVTWADLLKQIQSKISLINGDFRQQEIIEKWKSLSKDISDTQTFLVADLIIECSSGTYIRSIANEAGSRLGTSAVLSNLIRTKVGGCSIKDSIKLN
jgi:tRNA pseudouridine55 synthase